MSMFGALNRFISRLDANPEEQKRQGGTHGVSGFQVLRNTNQELALEPWFDFIIGINGRTIDNPDPHLFATEVRNCAGTTVSMGLWSAKGQRIREMYVQVPADSSSLGLSLQWAPLATSEDVWHILDVIPNSPADVAGLLPYGDYVIGSPEGLVRGENGLGELIEDFLERPLRLLVYNHEYNVARPVTITPSRNWGGTGALGCVLGFGALHRIPAPLDEPPQGPGETLFETAPTAHDEKFARPASSSSATHAANRPQKPGTPSFASPPSGDFLVPANMQFKGGDGGGEGGVAPGRGTPPAHKQARKHRAHHNVSPAKGLDEYFKEGEEKSKEQDFAPSGSSSVPPPPKGMGGPPKGPPKGGLPKSAEAGD
ncbi:GRASP55/65 PDZ-like domain-containing protein [Lineolata rhizophorae]|uniref:GRASP55/65 PDZ-like domain-containing protein n=1 Tax=Lineolata rhizophorae TaxID=578093 RepID=A0A6A6P7N5_9PEZI|nr:GRASP55/65 PDZ-like domain-containing protein [Lineolata rhizophorae]